MKRATMRTLDRSRHTERQSSGAQDEQHHASTTEQQVRQRSPDKVDESLEESFPASDPPSWVALDRIGPPKREVGV